MAGLTALWKVFGEVRLLSHEEKRALLEALAGVGCQKEVTCETISIEDALLRADQLKYFCRQSKASSSENWSNISEIFLTEQEVWIAIEFLASALQSPDPAATQASLPSRTPCIPQNPKPPSQITGKINNAISGLDNAISTLDGLLDAVSENDDD